MHVHILGICGTFMGGVALLAKSLGHRVTGSDENVYPPMSTQLAEQGIELTQGWDSSQLTPEPDIIVIGNAMRRGNPLVEYILDHNLRYTSGPQWLSENLLQDRWVIAVAGTHGKTTTSSMIAWILQHAGFDPGFLIGGIPLNFGVSAQLGSAPFFVVEADEYDTAFFDKRSKFVHYHPRTLVLNNLEYDHADIFPNLEAIKTQFHHLVRIVPNNGLIVANDDDVNLSETLKQGCWTPVQSFGSEADWQASPTTRTAFEVTYQGKTMGRVDWSLMGKHNQMNALCAIAAARHAGIDVNIATSALADFKSVKRRLEIRDVVNDITIYDDFAHHPTAIRLTVEGLRTNVGMARIVAVLDFRSNTMRAGIHKEAMKFTLSAADFVIVHRPDAMQWDPWEIKDELGAEALFPPSLDKIVSTVTELAKPSDHVLIMSNGAFGGIHEKLADALRGKFTG